MTTVLPLYDEITPALAKEFVREMTKLPATAEVTIAINSPGGSVPAGDAIAAAIDRHKGTMTCRIDGVAASAASFIAMFADRVVMARGAFIMIHCPWATMAGTADDFTNTAGTLREIERRYCSTYSVRSGMAEAEVMQLMQAETWLPAARAVELGFADEIDAALARAATVSAAVLKFRHVPMEIRAMAGAAGGRSKAQRDKLRRRYALIAAQARFSRDPKRDEEDRVRGARARRRYEMQDLVERVKADDRAVDAAERAAARRWQEQLYYDRSRGIPLQQGRERFARLEAERHR